MVSVSFTLHKMRVYHADSIPVLKSHDYFKFDKACVVIFLKVTSLGPAPNLHKLQTKPSNQHLVSQSYKEIMFGIRELKHAYCKW